MKGPGGIGKSQLSLKYKEKFGGNDQRKFFIDCVDFEGSLKAIFSGYFKNPPTDPKSLIPEFINLLKQEEKYLLIIDNVDDPDTSKELEKLIDGISPNSDAHILINGKDCTIPTAAIKEIEPFNLEDGKKLFLDIIGSKYKNDFENENDSDIQSFILDDLGGFPILIKTVALYFKEASNPKKLMTIEEYRKHRKNKNVLEVIIKGKLSAREIGYGKTLYDAYIPSIDRIHQSLFPGNNDSSPIYDILRFLAFFGSLKQIPINLKDMYTFFNSINPKFDFGLNHLNYILNMLKRYGIINITMNEKGEMNIHIHETTKLVIDLHFREELHQSLQDSLTIEFQNKYWSWFFKANAYLESLVAIDNINDTHINIFINFLEYLEKEQCPSELDLEFINNSKILNMLIQLTKEKPDRSKELLNILPSEKLIRLLQKIEDKIKATSDKEEQKKIAQALINLGQLFAHTYPGKAKLCFEKALEAGNRDAYFKLGAFYYDTYFNIISKNQDFVLNELNIESKNELLQKSINYLDEFIELNKSIENIDEIYNIRGIAKCELSLLDQGLKDFRRAIDFNPYSPTYHYNLSHFTLDSNEKEIQLRIAERLEQAQDNLENIPQNYKEFILRFLASEREFIYNPTTDNEILDFDNGAAFWQMLHLNPDIVNLNLSGKKIDDQSLDALATHIKSNQKLEQLQLDWNLKLPNFKILKLFSESSPNLKSVKLLGFDNNNTSDLKVKKEFFQKFINPNNISRIEMMLSGAQEFEVNRQLEEQFINSAFDLDYPDGDEELISAFLRLSSYPENEVRKADLLEKALLCCDRFIAINQTAQAYHLRGSIHALLNQENSAIADYREAILRDRYNPKYHAELSSIYAQNPNYELESQKHFRIAQGIETINSINKGLSKINFSLDNTLGEISKKPSLILKPQKNSSNSPLNVHLKSYTVVEDENYYSGLTPFEELPTKYQELIYSYLEAESYFELRESGNNHAMNDHGFNFGAVISCNPTITSLRLNGCHLDDHGVACIAINLRSINSNIEELRLEWNTLLTKKGVTALADTLQYNKKLKIISLIDCSNIEPEAILNLIEKAPKGLTIELSLFKSIERHRGEIEAKARERNVQIRFQPISWWMYLFNNH